MTAGSITNEMKVVADTSGTDNYRHFILETFQRIAAKLPHHSFIFISDKPFQLPFNFPQNTSWVIVKRSKISLFSQVKVSTLLKKYEADVFVTGQLVNTNIPQCFIALDKIEIRNSKRANVIVTDSVFSKKQLINKFRIADSKFEVVYGGVDSKYIPISEDQKDIIKYSLADGNEFFYAEVSSTSCLVNVLKAFSVLKRKLKSNVHLVINSQNPEEYSSLLNSYKFKSDVNLLENTDRKQLPVITASAYASICVNGHSAVLEAMQSHVPVIAANTGINLEIAGDAALYFDQNDHTDIADKMMLVYKDEKLRSRQIEKGIQQVEKYSWPNSADQLWKSIEKACL